MAKTARSQPAGAVNIVHGSKGWRVKSSGSTSGAFFTKDEAITEASKILRKAGGTLTVQGASGRIIFSRHFEKAAGKEPRSRQTKTAQTEAFIPPKFTDGEVEFYNAVGKGAAKTLLE